MQYCFFWQDRHNPLNCVFQVFIGYILYDVHTGKDCIRYVPIFACMSTLVTLLILYIRPHHASYVKSWKTVVIPVLFFLCIVIVSLALNWKAWAQQWCWLPKVKLSIYLCDLFFRRYVI